MFNQCIGCDLKRSDDEPIFDRLNVLCPICRISRYLNQFILTNIQHQQQHHQEVSLLTDEEIYDSIDYNLVAQFMKKKFSESTKIYALKQLSTSHKSMNHIKVLLLKDEYLKKFKFGSMTDRVIVQQCNKFIKHINQFGVLSFDEEESEDDVAEILPRVESSSSSPEVQEIPPTEKTEQQPKLSSVRKRSIEDDKDANNSTKKPNNDKILESTDKNQNTNPALPMDPQKTQQEILSIPITNQSVSINMTTPKTQMTSSNLVQQSNTVANKNLATQNPPSQSKPPSSSKTLTCIKCNTDWNAEYGFSFNLTSLCPQCYLINNLLGFGENLPHLERLYALNQVYDSDSTFKLWVKNMFLEKDEYLNQFKTRPFSYECESKRLNGDMSHELSNNSSPKCTSCGKPKSLDPFFPTCCLCRLNQAVSYGYAIPKETKLSALKTVLTSTDPTVQALESHFLKDEYLSQFIGKKFDYASELKKLP